MENHSKEHLIYNLLQNPFSINEWKKLLEKIAENCGYKYIRYGTFWRRYYRRHKGDLAALKSMLADDRSVETIDCLVKCRTTRRKKYLYKVAEVAYQTYAFSKDLPPIKYRSSQYFPDMLKLSENEVFVDVGAYIGDTLFSFVEHTSGKFKKIIAFEALKSQSEQLRQNINASNVDTGKIDIYGVGLDSECKEVLSTDNGSNSSSRIIGKTNTIPTKLVVFDDFLSEEERSQVTFVKMDIEGAEREALRGMAKTIASYHPKLAICIYHLPDDWWIIPSYIQQLYPAYRFFVRQHEVKFDSETVLYAIP
jgi:FkbM family methyltransferase